MHPQGSAVSGLSAGYCKPIGLLVIPRCTINTLIILKLSLSLPTTCCRWFKFNSTHLEINSETPLLSLVPRLPHSGTRTLKLCMRVESLVFFLTWEALKDRHKVDATLIVRGCMRLSTEKGKKVAGDLLHVSSYRVSNIIHTERWSIVGWTTRKTLPFCFCPILVMSCLRTKDTRLSRSYIFAFRESLGTRLPTTQNFWNADMLS